MKAAPDDKLAMTLWQKHLLTASLYAICLALLSYFGPRATKRAPASAVSGASCEEAMGVLMLGREAFWRQQMELLLKEAGGGASPAQASAWMKRWQELGESGEVKRSQVDELIADMVKLHQPRLISLFDADEELALRLYREELWRLSVEKGLYGAFEEVGIKVNASSWRRFWSTSSGEALKVSFGSLGVFWGLPPLYLPKLGIDVLNPGEHGALFKSKLAYNYWRKHYMVFAGLASAAVSAYWFHLESEALTEEAQEIEFFEQSALGLLESIKMSNERLLGQGACRFVEDCVDSQGILPSASEYEAYYESCREILGPDFREC